MLKGYRFERVRWLLGSYECTSCHPVISPSLGELLRILFPRWRTLSVQMPLLTSNKVFSFTGRSNLRLGMSLLISEKMPFV